MCDCFQKDDLKAKMSVESFPALVTNFKAHLVGAKTMSPQPGKNTRIVPAGFS